MSATALCPVPGCNLRRRANHVMCGRCWRTVPPAMQRTIWQLYREQQGSAAHLTAMQAAIGHASERLRNR